MSRRISSPKSLPMPDPFRTSNTPTCSSRVGSACYSCITSFIVITPLVFEPCRNTPHSVLFSLCLYRYFLHIQDFPANMFCHSLHDNERRCVSGLCWE